MEQKPFRVGDALYLDASCSETPHWGSLVDVLEIRERQPRSSSIRCILVECKSSGGPMLIGERAVVAPSRLMTHDEYDEGCEKTRQVVSERERKKDFTAKVVMAIRALKLPTLRVNMGCHGAINLDSTDPQHDLLAVAHAILACCQTTAICGLFEIPTEGGGDADAYLCTRPKGHEGGHRDPAWPVDRFYPPDDHLRENPVIKAFLP